MKSKTNSFEIATGVIQKLLFDKPLYDYIDSQNVNILVFGFTELCRRFIDIAFEVSQVNGFKLNILVVSNTCNAKEIYIKDRPAFKDFFEVDGVKIENSYGALAFSYADFNCEIDNIVSEFLLDEDKKYSYVFIDCDNDSKNYAIAKICNVCRDMLYNNPIINYVSSKQRKTSKYLNAVLRDDTIKNHKSYSRFKRMALNCHLLWKNSDFIDIRKLQREFNKSYNFSSSLSNVLSIKYKLNSVGIDFDAPDAADKFYELNKTEKGKIAGLVQAEHNRWNVSMICHGWSTQKNLNNCLNGIKDYANKLHPCIVHCDNRIVLENTWKNNNYEKWDTVSSSEIEKLDRLDQVSVKLHRLFRAKAGEIKSNNVISVNDIYEIQKQLLNYEDALFAFSKYLVCINSVVSGSAVEVKQHDYYLNKLVAALKYVPENIKKNVTKRVEFLESDLTPVFESQKYTDYKSFDHILVKNIPFILTYRTNIHLCIPLEINNDNASNQVLFRNVASSLYINPSRITYFFEISSDNQDKLLEALQYACQCMNSHNIRANINLCLLSSDLNNESRIETIKNVSKRIKRIDSIVYKNEDELEEKLYEYLKVRRFNAIEKNGSETSGRFYGMRVFRNNPYYVFNSKNAEILCYNDCNELRYIPFRPSLKISDLFESKSSYDKISLPDFQEDYAFFWNIYRESDSSCAAWKCLCNSLEKTDSDENLIKFDIRKKKDEFFEKIYFVENSYFDSIKLILKHLAGAKTEFRFKADFHTNGIYKLTVNGTEDMHAQIVRLLSNPYLLRNQFDIDIDKNWEYERVLPNNLVVGKLYEKTIKDNAFSLKEPYESVGKILVRLSENGYIVNLHKSSDENGRYFSFTYTSHQLKALMTSAGRILELYVYYQLINTHYVNEVANSVEIERKNNGVKNELDIVLTSGFRSIIIECKAQSKLKQDFYYKLDNLNRIFGINSIAILIADLNEKHWQDNSENEIQRSRGKESGIITVYDPKDIDNIANTIKTILKSS